MRFVQIENSEFSELFIVVKQSLFEHVEAVFGWDDEFQVNRLKNDYQMHWFYWIYIHGEKVGLICHKPNGKSQHVHLLLLLPEYQRQGIGKLVMTTLHTLARDTHQHSVTLSSFKRNGSALKFYQSLGYEVIETEEHFVSLSKDIRV
jgi:ribosomal protein S18 acetylase RimI-like enzyme